MARHNGHDGIVKHGTNVLDGLREWSLDTSIETQDLTAAGDDWADHDTSAKSWSGSINMLLDHAAAANQSLSVGDQVTLELYSEGNGSGKTFFTGTATITGTAVGSPYNGEATRNYTFQGKGALATDTVE